MGRGKRQYLANATSRIDPLGSELSAIGGGGGKPGPLRKTFLVIPASPLGMETAHLAGVSRYQRQLATIRFLVSNSSMTLLGFVKRASLLIALTALIFVAGLSVYLRIEQYKFRRQAEQLLSDVRELELKKASAAEVKVVLTKWGFREWGRGPGQPCTEDECMYRLELVPKTQGHDLGGPFHSVFSVRPLAWLGLRPTLVQAWVRIRGKALRVCFILRLDGGTRMRRTWPTRLHADGLCEYQTAQEARGVRTNNQMSS